MMMSRRHLSHSEVSCELIFSTAWIKVYSINSREDSTTGVIVSPILCPLMMSCLAYNFHHYTYIMR